VPDGRPDLAGRTILAVLAHPDDESLACGGTLALAANAGARVVLLCATRGERGSISDPSLVPDGNLGFVREQELRDAARILGVTDLLVFDHPDGDIRWAHVPILHEEIVAAVRHYNPDAVITFDEDGLYWHLDHIGIHERTYTAVKSFGAEAPPLYYVTMAQGVMAEIFEVAQARSGAHDPSFWGIHPDAFGDAAMPPTFVIDVRPVVARKLAALRCHRTQMGIRNPFAWIDEAEAGRLLGREPFRRAPLESRPDALLESLGMPATAQG